MRKVIWVFLVIFFVSFFISGCATVMTGPRQRVPVDSDPPQADVKADTGEAGVTPCILVLQRKMNHFLEISKKGYETAKVTLHQTLSGATFGNVLLGGIIGIGVDAGTGAMYKLVPEKVFVTLKKIDTKETKAEEKAEEIIAGEERVSIPPKPSAISESAISEEVTATSSPTISISTKDIVDRAKIEASKEGVYVEDSAINIKKDGNVWVLTFRPRSPQLKENTATVYLEQTDNGELIFNKIEKSETDSEQ